MENSPQSHRGHRGKLVSNDQTLDAFLQEADVEIQQQAAMNAAQLQVGEELGFVDRMQRIHGLQLQYELMLYDNVHVQLGVDRHALVDQREGHLALVLDPSQLQLVTQAALVHRFEQSRTQHAMYFDGRADDCLCQRISFHGFSSSVPSVSLW